MRKLNIFVVSIGFIVAGCSATGGHNSTSRYDINKINKIERLARNASSNIDIIWVNPPKIKD